LLFNFNFLQIFILVNLMFFFLISKDTSLFGSIFHVASRQNHFLFLQVPKKYHRFLLDMSNEGNKGPPSAITLGFSILTHFLLIAPVIYILVIAFENYSFFSWHPICMSVGVSIERTKKTAWIFHQKNCRETVNLI